MQKVPALKKPSKTKHLNSWGSFTRHEESLQAWLCHHSPALFFFCQFPPAIHSLFVNSWSLAKLQERDSSGRVLRACPEANSPALSFSALSISAQFLCSSPLFLRAFNTPWCQLIILISLLPPLRQVFNRFLLPPAGLQAGGMKPSTTSYIATKQSPFYSFINFRKTIFLILPHSSFSASYPLPLLCVPPLFFLPYAFS